MNDWDQSTSARYVDGRTGAIALAPEGAADLFRRIQVGGGVDLGLARSALEEELTKLLQPTWAEVWLTVFKTARALREAARAPAGESRLVKLLGVELPLSAPFDLCVTWSGTQLPAVTGKLTMTVEFNVSVKVRDGCLCEIAPFTWTATPSIEVADSEVWKAEPREHELGKHYVLKTPMAIG